MPMFNSYVKLPEGISRVPKAHVYGTLYNILHNYIYIYNVYVILLFIIVWVTDKIIVILI